MKTIIIYDSKYGCTKKCAYLLKDKLIDAEVYNVKDFHKDINEYDGIIIGSPIYIGKTLKSIRKFCVKNLSILLNKPLALFTCGIRPGEEGKIQLASAYPKELSDKAKVLANFGGEIIYQKLRFLDRKLTNMVSSAKGSNFPKFDENKEILLIDEETITNFVEKYQKRLGQ